MITAAEHRKDRNIHKLHEDEVTSSVFGPLVLLPADQIWTLFRRILPGESLWLDQIPDRSEMSFWKRFNTPSDGQTVEPDLLVRFLKGGRPVLNVMIEVKWNARLSSEDQLIKQWMCFGEHERERCLHIYLVKDGAKGWSDIEQSLELGKARNDFSVKEWKERLFCLGWRELGDILQACCCEWSAPLALWAKGVVSFLKRAELAPFTGFEWLRSFDVSPILSSPLIWADISWFSYLQENSAIHPPRQDQPLIWRG